MIDSLRNGIFSFVKKHNYFLLLTAILIAMSLVLYRHYIFGGRLFLFEDFGSDSVRVSFPTYVYFFDWLRHGMPLWSDQMGIGTSILSHADIIFDPFTYILFILGKNGIIYMFVYVVILKIILSGIFFWLFIGKFSKYALSSFAKIIGAITYAFGGYMIVTGQNYVFATVYVYLPLILLGYEVWLQNRKKWLLILMLTATALYFYYLFYMTVIFFTIYVALRYFMVYQFRLKHFLQYISTLAGYGLLSLCLSAFFWLPSVALTFSNLRVGASKLALGNMFLPDFSRGYGLLKVPMVITALGRFLGNDTLGTGNSISYLGYKGDYFQLALYCGIITIILIPQIFCEENKKKKLIYGIFSLVLTALLFVPFFTYVFNGFSEFTYRWTYVLHFSLALLLTIAVNTVYEKAKLNYIVFFATIGSLFLISLLVIFSISSLEAKGINSLLIKSFSGFIPSYILIVAYAVLTILFFRSNYKKSIKIIILTLVCIELVWFPSFFINDRLTTSPDPVKYKLGFFDNTNNAINYLKNSDNDVYRVDKSYESVMSEYSKVPSDNDALVQGYRGLKSYNANNQPNYIRFLQTSGVFVKNPNYLPPVNTKPQDIKGADLNYINGVGDRYLLQSFLGVKYFLTRTYIPLPDYYQYITTTDGIAIHKNTNYLPLGFTFDRFITYEEFMRLDNGLKDVSLLSSVVVDNSRDLSGGVSHNNSVLPSIISETDVSNAINERRNNSLKLTSYKSDDIKGEIQIRQNKVLVFTIPYDLGWTIYVDGHKNMPLKVDGGLIGVNLLPGQHIIELKYFPQMMKLGIIISSITLLCILLFLLITNKKNIVKIVSMSISCLAQSYAAYVSYQDTLVSKLGVKKTIFYIASIWGILVFILSGFITRGYSFYNLFNPDKTNSYMDFFNSMYTLYYGPYTHQSIYPPLPLLMYKFMLRLVPYDIARKGALAIRTSETGQVVFLLYTLITLFLFFILIMEIKKGTKVEKYIFLFLTLLSAPFLFQFERGNIIFVALLFLMIFVFLKDSKKRVIKEISIISLAIASGIKLYPAIFGLLLVKEKRFKEVFRAVIYGAAAFILPFFAVGGISQIRVLFKNISSTSNMVIDWGLGYSVSIQTIIRIFFGFFGDFGTHPMFIGKIVSAIVFISGIISAFVLPSKWKTVAVFSLLMILIPGISFEYTLIFMLIPLMMFLDRGGEEQPIDYVYLVCFILIFIPLTLNRVDFINHGFGWSILPLAYGVLLQNIAVSTMAICLIVEGLNQGTVKRPSQVIWKYVCAILVKIYDVKSKGIAGYTLITTKVIITFLLIAILFGDDIFSVLFAHRPYSYARQVNIQNDHHVPVIVNIEPKYLHYGDKVVLTANGISQGPKKHVIILSSFGEMQPLSWSDNEFIFSVPLNWRIGTVKIWAVKAPDKYDKTFHMSNIVEVYILDRLGAFNNDDINYFGQIKYLHKETRDINNFKNYKLRNYKFSRWIPTKVFQLYADIVEWVTFIRKQNTR